MSKFSPEHMSGWVNFSQLDFEIAFFESLLQKIPDYLDVLRAHSNNLAAKGSIHQALKLDQQLIRLYPRDATAHYNLACRYALTDQRELAFSTLRRAIELGYRDFRYMRIDPDLELVRADPRFRALLKEYNAW